MELKDNNIIWKKPMYGFSNLTSKQMLECKIHYILYEYYRYNRFYKVTYFNINNFLDVKETLDGFMIKINVSLNTLIIDKVFFISKEIINKIKFYEDNTPNLNQVYGILEKYSNTQNMWENIKSKWDQKKIVPNNLVINLTYRRFFTQSSSPVKEIK